MKNLHKIGKEKQGLSLADLVTKYSSQLYSNQLNNHYVYRSNFITNEMYNTTVTADTLHPTILKIHAFCEVCGMRMEAMTYYTNMRLHVEHIGDNDHRPTFERDEYADTRLWG